MDVISMISKQPGLPDGPVEGLYSPCMYGTCNGPRVHEYLQEMNKRVLSKYDLLTVGETAGVTIDEAKRYANSEGTELGMVFQFEHVGLDSGKIDKWSDAPMSLPLLKENLSKWQNELDQVAWNSIYFCNHDQPRVVSRLGDNSPKSAKCIATMLHMMQGTPYVYQGEELGMTNCPFGSIENYRDIESINAYKELVEAGLRQPEELLRCIAYKSRDNARTPMQWNDKKNAGFTEGDSTWIMVNPNYKEINAEKEVSDPDSVFNYYKRLISLRRESQWKDLIVYGKYTLISPEDENVYAYIRQSDNQKLIVICNFSDTKQVYELPEEVIFEESKSIITNGLETKLERKMELEPWQASVWSLQ